MPIYVQSRGKNQDQDYRWLKIESDRYYPEKPSFLLQFINNSLFKPVDLIESQKQSVILVADRDNYYLLVTGLKARERTDFAGRSIRNSILWICQKDSETKKVRSLLIRALKGKLEQEIDKTINASGKYGFEVDYESLVERSNSVLDIKNNQNTDLSYKIGGNCVSLREEIALELESNVLPNKEGLLVLVTSLKSADSLKKTRVWRGLSNRVKSEELEKYGSLAITQFTAEKKTLWLGIAIALVSIIAIVITVKLITSTQPQIEKSPSSIQNPYPNSSNFLEKQSNSIKSSLNCQIAQKKNFFLSPCSFNNSNN